MSCRTACNTSSLRPLTACALLAVSTTAHAELARPDHIADSSKRLDEIVMVMAHNAFNHAGVLPNQRLTIQQQLDRGVRGFMLDVHKKSGELYVCHGTCNPAISRVAPLSRDLETIQRFLDTHPSAVIAIHLEPYIEKADLERLRDQRPDLFKHTFNPRSPSWQAHKNWPTIKELQSSNQRLLLISQDQKISGDLTNSTSHVMFDQDIMVQNTYNIGDTIGQHDFSCTTRWNGIPLNTETGLKGWKRLFLMNHFHKVPELIHGDYDNHWEYIEAREIKHCKRMPNFVAIDSVERGDALEYVEHRNNGGVVAYEGDDATQNVVCGFSSAIAHNWSMKDGERLGCENDEMRSLKIRGVKKGQRITFYDRADGGRDDDFGVLNIDRDIPWDSPVVLNTLDSVQYRPAFRYLYSGGNGLAGKVSHIRVEPAASPHGEAAVILMRGDGGTQRISCAFGLTRSSFWNMKNEPSCHNDDARSVKVMAAKEGTVITLYDSPSGSTSDDYTTFRIKQDLTKVWTVVTLEESGENEYMAVKHHHVNGLNGKVSSVRVSVP
ncbi:hypothetical protein EDF77_3207 [Stenotrophomonas maltophilia]|uniref:hypothetical protein n=1 Tax=Stenotrophomonas chelatiphaga TaxID=517011 RepID=UPI000F912701|nr:hypothetical protein [Stenotrophomonas chelatiphaga]MCS4229945.1 hypothetical protein [Stenotrophomonas chelatiphaga]ROQ38131.1 hypothetical protein EDF77_3207 [Stenotrophomonas maltophilia]